jgi:hypothetical protein
MKHITGSSLVQTGESSFIKEDYAYHSCIYENESWKLEILEVEKDSNCWYSILYYRAMYIPDKEKQEKNKKKHWPNIFILFNIE